MNRIEITTTPDTASWLLKEMGNDTEAKFVLEQQQYNRASLIIVLEQRAETDYPVLGVHSSCLFIRKCCCKIMEITEDDIQLKCRKRAITDCRKIFSYLGWLYTTATLERLGTYIGKLDHSSVLHNRDEATELNDRAFRKKLRTAEMLVQTKLNKLRTVETN